MGSDCKPFKALWNSGKENIHQNPQHPPAIYLKTNKEAVPSWFFGPLSKSSRVQLVTFFNPWLAYYSCVAWNCHKLDIWFQTGSGENETWIWHLPLIPVIRDNTWWYNINQYNTSIVSHNFTSARKSSARKNDGWKLWKKPLESHHAENPTKSNFLLTSPTWAW